MRRVSRSRFEEECRKLNVQQGRAVETIEGPVMVVAGPGTGKTQVIALRVANILRRTHMRPSNILCLTFSVAAATEMRLRLRGIMGPDAYGVTIANFHGFCNDLILDHPLIFEEWGALEHISDIERYRTVNWIIEELPPTMSLVSRKQPHLQTGNILERIAELKREGVTNRAELLRVADAYDRRMGEASKPGTKQHERDRNRAKRFREFLEVFFHYQEALKESRRYDYEDMILVVLEALREHDWLLASLQERYQYILVDEFQDTNGAQAKLLELLTTYAEGVRQDPNLFVVGDDDQAIYRFQGATIRNILALRERFPSAPVIPLTASYRCSQTILNAAGRLIARNTGRLVGNVAGFSKNLTAAGKRRGESPLLFLSESERTEPWLVADLIEERLHRDVHPEDIAVLVRTNAELQPLYDVLRARRIPVRMSGKVDLLLHPKIQQVIAILRAVVHPEQNALLAAALSCDCFACHPADLGRLFLLRRERECTLLELLLSVEDGGRNMEDGRALMRARDVLLALHQKLPVRTVVETLEHLYRDTCLLAEAEKSPEDFVPLQEFFERMKYRAYEQPGFSVQGLLRDLEYFEQPEYRELRLGYEVPHLVTAGVELLTAHQSKGREFSTVILPGFREGHWGDRRPHRQITVPEDLLFGWETEERCIERQEDERRLAYVAMTRARDELLMTCPKELVLGDKVRGAVPSALFAEAGPLPEEERKLHRPGEATTLLAPPVLVSDRAFRTFLTERLERFALSVTALNHFLEDPRTFLAIDLLETPQAKHSFLVYGNAVHEALRKWGLSAQQGTPLLCESFLEAFRMYLREREILTERERERLRALGEEALPRYFAARLSGAQPIVHKVEGTFSTHLRDIPLKGKIDRIDLLHPTSARARIIDFKTGQIKTEREIRGGDYFRQIVFYSLLLEQSRSILKPEAFVLDFVGEGNSAPTERVFDVTAADRREMERLIEAVWAKVLALDFTPL